MDSDQTPNLPPDVWFNQQITPPPPEMKSNKGGRSRLILIAAVVTVTLLVGATIFLLQKNNCFKPENYSGLMDIIATTSGENVSTDDIVANEPLYYREIRFLETSMTEFDTTMIDDPTPFFQQLGKYYEANHSAAPFIIQLDAQYNTDDSPALAKQRLIKIKAALMQAGIDSSSISVKAPIKAPTDELSLVSDNAINGLPVTLSITPVLRENCLP